MHFRKVQIMKQKITSLEQLLQIQTARGVVWLDEENAAYIKRGAGNPQIWEVNLKTGEHKQRTEGKENIWSITAHPQSGGILYGIDKGGNENHQMYVLERGATEPKALTDKPHARHMLGGLTADGKTLIYTNNARVPQTFDLCAKDLETGEERIVIEMSDNYNWPPYKALSPDGKYVLLNKLLGTSDNALWIADCQNGTAVRVPDDKLVSAETSPTWKSDSSGFYLLSDRAEEFPTVCYYDVQSKSMKTVLDLNMEIENLSLSSDDRYLAVAANEDGYIELRIFDTQNHFAELNCPRLPKGVVSNYSTISWSPSEYKLLVSLTSGKRPENIWLIDLDAETLAPVTSSGIDTSDFVEPELVKYSSFDGLTVPFWLYVPKGKQRKNLPVIIDIHGGPEGQETSAFSGFTQYLLSEGFAIAAPNIRGSTGYGKTYTHLDDVEKRLDSVTDIEYLVKYLIDSGIADESKIAVMGVSYGGFMTLSCVTRLPKLWACAIDTVGMYNLVSFLENTAEYRRAHRESEYGSLKHHRDILRKVSPIDKIDDIEAPLMVVQGRNDPRVPADEAEQIVGTLQARGHTVEYLCYEDEGHGIAKLKNQLDCYPKMAAFLKKYM